MSLQDLVVIIACTIAVAIGWPLVEYAWEKRDVIARFLRGSSSTVMSRAASRRLARNEGANGDFRRVVGDNNNDATPTNRVATPATVFNVLLSAQEAAALANDPKVEPVDVVLWEGRADALAALVAAGALKVTETEASTIIYGIKPSGTSPRWKLLRAAVEAAKARRAPPRYQPLDEHRRPVLES